MLVTNKNSIFAKEIRNLNFAKKLAEKRGTRCVVESQPILTSRHPSNS